MFAVGESRYRPEALAKSGKAQFPVLVDPNYDPPLVITESKSIVTHLWNNYGNAATVPFHCKVTDEIMLSVTHVWIVLYIPIYKSVYIIPLRSHDTASLRFAVVLIKAFLFHNFIFYIHIKLADASSMLLFLPSLFRPLPEHGLIQTPAKLPKEMLELYQFEPSPFCKMVR